MKTIASNYVAGFMILLDRSIRIGNIIAIDATTSGEVTRITTRYTVVRTLAGTEVIVPNEYLVGNIVRNQTYTDTQVRVPLPVTVAYSADLELAMPRQHFLFEADPVVFQTEAKIGLSRDDFAFKFAFQRFDAGQQFVDFRVHAGSGFHKKRAKRHVSHPPSRTTVVVSYKLIFTALGSATELGDETGCRP